MANKSLGVLTIDVIAKTGGFVSGIEKAERASAKWREQVVKDASSASAGLAKVAGVAITAATAAGAAGFHLLKSTAKQISEIDKLSSSLKISTQDLLSWQYAAEKAGLYGNKIADIFRDIDDKIGDAVINKSGQAVKALNALGLSAVKLSELTPDQKLLVIGDALGKIKTNAEKITILESLGGDLSKLIPLFDNNNKKLKEFIKLSKDYGIAPDQKSIDDLLKIDSLFEEIEDSVRGLKIEIASGLAKVDLSAITKSFENVRNILTDPNVLNGLVQLVSKVAELGGWIVTIASKAGEIATITGNRVAAISGNVDITNSAEIQERINYLTKTISNYSKNGSLFGRLLGIDDTEKSARDELTRLYDALAKLREEQNKNNLINLPVAQATVGNGYELGLGEKNGKQKIDSGVKKLQNAYKSLELSYLRQIALIETTGRKTEEVTEFQKLQFDIADGKLAGVNEKQKVRLEQLAKELDQLKNLRKENIENLKVASYAAGLQNQNRNDAAVLNSDFVGAGLGDKARDRMRERLEIERGFLNQQHELQLQYQSGDIEKSLYDKQTAVLQEALNDRLKIQEEYYQQADEQKSDWESGLSDALMNFADNASDYYQQAADALTSVMDSATSSVSSNLYDLVTGAEDLGDAFSNAFADLGKSIIRVLADIAAQWLVYQAVQLLVGKTAQSSAATGLIANAQATSLQAQLAAYASTAAIPIVGPGLAPAAMAAAAAATIPLAAGVTTAALSGMAHDGLDRVPETGTWLLQQGERVTTAQTSAKLDATLDRVNRDAVGNRGNIYAPNINIPINGNPSDATIQLVKRAADEGAARGYRQAVNSIATGTGDLHKVLMAKTNAGRRIG
ncbi:phage tail tape measure protein [Entomohabitans teleogrylli]|uniref:phage tail tape measure protein n=1 Tax=Entomohabitans teleogrylli TaxID=1384589 RepID=UPI00073D6766|nr:phage tail tape measure protein [Entomohabitans teleogrylli]